MSPRLPFPASPQFSPGTNPRPPAFPILIAGAAGKLTGDMISLDQDSPRIAVEALTEKDGTVQFDVPQIRGGFSGKLNADDSEIAGEWTQGGRATPLVFKRLAAKS